MCVHPPSTEHLSSSRYVPANVVDHMAKHPPFSSSLPISVPSWSRIILQKPLFARLIETLPNFMEPKGSLPCLQ
jgi:hypothetical protein